MTYAKQIELAERKPLIAEDILLKKSITASMLDMDVKTLNDFLEDNNIKPVYLRRGNKAPLIRYRLSDIRKLELKMKDV